MNEVETVLLNELKEADYESLIRYRVRKILMICSHYDAFILEEDGQIESHPKCHVPMACIDKLQSAKGKRGKMSLRGKTVLR